MSVPPAGSSAKRAARTFGMDSTSSTVREQWARADLPVRRLHRDGGAAIRPRGLEAFRALVATVGWTVDHAVERPFSDHVRLLPTAPRRAGTWGSGHASSSQSSPASSPNFTA